MTQHQTEQVSALLGLWERAEREGIEPSLVASFSAGKSCLPAFSRCSKSWAEASCADVSSAAGVLRLVVPPMPSLLRKEVFILP